MTTSTTPSSLAVQNIGGSNYQSIIDAIQEGGVTAKMGEVPVGSSGRTNNQMALYDSSGNLIPASALGSIYPNGDGTYTIQIGSGDGGALNIVTQADANGKLSPIQNNNQVSYTGGSNGSVLGSLASAAQPIALPLAIAAIAATNPELLPSFGTDTLGADVIPASTAAGATSAAAADEASGLASLGLGQAGTEAASALPAAAGATASGALPVDLANTAFVPTAGATAGDLAIATDPVAANIAAGMTPEAASAAAAAGVAANATQGLTAAQAAALAGTSGLADAAAAAKLASSLTNSSGSIPVTASGGTTGGSSSGPWNQSISPGVSKIGASKTTAWADPLSGLMTSIVPTYSPSQGALGNIMSHEYQGELSPTSGYAKGGKVKNDLDKFDPDFVKVIKERVPDHHHPNYNGKALFRTGGLGKHVQGPGTGQSDDIPAMLADGEYVFDADTVSALGDGSNKAGAEALDKMREAIRKHKRSAPIDKIPPKAKSPLEYLKGKHK